MFLPSVTTPVSVQFSRSVVFDISDSKRDGEGLASEEKVIFVLIWASPFVSFPQIPQKEYLRSWDKSHWKASSGPLRASITKGRNPLHFQSE